METMTPSPSSLLSPVRRCLLRLYGTAGVAALYEALAAVCRELLACDHVSVLTFQPHGQRARLRYTNHPELASQVGELMAFDDGPICAALRSGACASAPGAEPWVWTPQAGGCVVSARAVRPLAFDGEAYGGLLFHDLADEKDGPGGEETAIYLDIVAEATGTALMRCELNEERSRQVVDSRVRLTAITRMGDVLNSLDLEVLLQRMMDVAMSAVHGQVGSIVLVRDGTFTTVVEWGLDQSVVESIHYANGRSVMEEVYETRLPILVTDVGSQTRLRVRRDDVQIESYLCIPLHTRRGALGVLNIINSATGHAFSDRDMDLLLTICNLASAGVENALLHEEAMVGARMSTQLDIASGIQKSLLPEVAPSVPGLDMAGWNHPCEAVGGDYFDFLQLDDGRTAVVIGDVSGHGVGPALLMSSARAALRSFISCEIGPEEIMEHLNRLLTGQVLTPGTFISMIFAVVQADGREIVFTNAGHPLPLVFNAASLSIAEPDERGMVLGVDPDTDYPAAKLTVLGAGDIVAFYTDGILDATDGRGEYFGKDRLIKVLVANRQLPARNIINAARAEIGTFCGDKPPADDLTLVLVKGL